MKTIKPEINWEELVTSNLPTEKGIDNAVNFKGIPLATIDSIFDKIATDYEEITDFNSWEWDWDTNVIINGKTYNVWGSAHSCSMSIELED